MNDRQPKDGDVAGEQARESTKRFGATGADGKPLGFSTLAVHGGEPRPKLGNALATPIVQTATYTFADTQEIHDHFQRRIEREEYGRYGNPTQRIAEQKLAALEGAEDCLLFSSGMAAVTTAMYAVLSHNSHVVVTDDSYRRTRQFLTQTLHRYGIEVSVVPAGDYEAIAEAIRPTTRLLVSESPTNPYNCIVDLERFADIGRRHRIKTLIDATFATPFNQRPLAYGIDIVLHSATKYLGGHNDLLAGAILGSAEFLAAHPKVTAVHYAGLPSHPQHEIARRQMRGFGGVVSFEIAGDLETTSRVVDACRIPQIAPSLGGVESLIEQPALMSFYELTTEERLMVGIKDNLIRYSVGIEDSADLIADLAGALERA